MNPDLVQEWRKQDPFLMDIDGFQKFLDKRIPQVLKEQEKLAKHKWNLFFSMWERPIVYDSFGRLWADTVPQWLKVEIILERLIQVMTGEEGMATDAEVVAHLYTASLARPIGHWTQIYLYLTIKVMNRAGQKRDYAALEKELGIKELTIYQQDKVDHLKRDLWNAGMRAAKEKRRERKRKLKNL